MSVKPVVRKICIEVNLDTGFFYIIQTGKTYKTKNIDYFNSQLQKELHNIKQQYFERQKELQNKQKSKGELEII